MTRERSALRMSLICGAAIVPLLVGAPALAQDAAEIEEVVVTGSQIRGASTTGALPVSVVSQEDIKALGGVSGEDLYRSLPQAGDVSFNTQTLSGGSQGAARGDVSSINRAASGPATRWC